MTNDKFFLDKKEPVRSGLLALREIILAADPNISETTKYGMPCFCYGKKAMCYLWTDKKTGEPYMLMVEGKALSHPRLETGERARMKILRMDPSKDLPIRVIKSILKQAVELYRR